MLSFFMIVLVAFALALGLTPLSMWMVNKYVVKRVRRAKKVKRVLPYMGGVAMIVAFVAAAWLSRFMPVPFLDSQEPIRFQGLLIGVSLALLCGFTNDYDELPHWWLMPFLLGPLVISHLIVIEMLPGGIVLPSLLFIPVTTLWVVGVMNTVNSLDGLDGLAVGVVAIASAVLALQMYRDQQFSIALLAVALLGVTLGLLPYTLYSGRTLIGSSGTHFLGYVLAVLAILGAPRIVTLLLVLSLPILDTGWHVLNLVTRQRVGDSRALYHHLMDMGLNRPLAILSYWGISAMFGFLLLFLPGSIYKALAILLVLLLDVMVRWVLPRVRVRRVNRALAPK